MVPCRAWGADRVALVRPVQRAGRRRLGRGSAIRGRSASLRGRWEGEAVLAVAGGAGGDVQFLPFGGERRVGGLGDLGVGDPSWSYYRACGSAMGCQASSCRRTDSSAEPGTNSRAEPAVRQSSGPA
jgi:hypothetical protein